ncbi:MAG: insulinase family protein [Proteobacteria bacterium]|nr:insulinase family protein [Pseudomonadota bacterium]
MIERYTLKNGIPVFVVENHASPVVTVQAWISRGSVYETGKIAGISHFLEHSLFKGTKNRKVGEIALEIESCGGEINAFTSFEETVYYTTLGSRYFEKGLDIIADAVQNPTFDPEEMRREREVILEEIKRSQDSPYRTVSHNLWKTAFPNSPYGRPVLGYDSTVKNIDHRTLRAYFSKNYHAGSTYLFIVGDIDKKKAFALAQQKFGRMKKQKSVSIPKVPDYSSAKKVRVVLAEKDIKECSIQIAWPTPPLDDSGIPALDVLCTALGQGESCLLYQHLVKDTKVAQDVNMGLIATARCGMAVIGLQVTPENFETAIRETVNLLHRITPQGIQESEIERVKSSLESEVIAGKETVEGYARRLGYYTIQFGDPESEQKYLNSILSVQKSACDEALTQLLKTKPVLSAIHPLGLKVDIKKLESLLSASPVKSALPKEVSPQLELKKKSSVRFVEKWMNHLPVVSVKMIFPGGIREESKEKLGLGTLLQRVWTSGTPHYNSKQIAYQLDSLGASIGAFVGRHTMGLSIEFLSKQWTAVKPLLSEILLNPTFPENEFEIEKEILLQDIRSERDTPGQICQLNFMQALYHHHPYGRSSLGKLDTVSSLTSKDLRDFYRNYIHQSEVVVSTVGHFDRGAWEKEIAEILHSLPQTGKKITPTLPITENNRLSVVLEKKEPLSQSHMIIGFLGPSLHNPDRFALKLLNSCLSGQGGRLFLELRDKQSLAYTVAPLASENPDGGMFGVYIGCSPEKLPVAIHGIRKELEKTLDRAMTSKELARAKQYWIGRFELEMQRFSSQSMMFGLDEAYGLGFDHSLRVADRIKSITAEEIRAIAEKYLHLDKATISIVHNQQVEEAFIRHAWEGQTSPTRKTSKASEPLLERS